MEALKLPNHLLQDLIHLVWGPTIKPEVFARWSQGFTFSEDENTALIQTSGGPCAVIAPVQAFLLKRLMPHYGLDEMKELDIATVDKCLASTLAEVLYQCRDSNHPSNGDTYCMESDTVFDNVEGPFRLACLDDPLPSQRNSPSNICELDGIDGINSAYRDHQLFHSSVRLRQFETKHSLHSFIENNVDKFKAEFGILLFLYSVVLTKGIARVNEERGEAGESLIDRTQGHGCQALINLLITGRASSYVWDGVKDVGGLRLIGVLKRPTVGFLTHLEHLHYVQVGWYLKNPLSPVWVLGSATHLSVLFSWVTSLITPDTEIERGKQVFTWYDTEGNNFIKRDQLKSILGTLNLCSDDDFVKFMCSELDPENTGVILCNKFLEAFYNVSESFRPPDSFAIHHYNGLELSCPSGKIQFAEGCLTIQDNSVKFAPTSDISCCLNTKWQNSDIQWTTFQPSLN